MTSLRRLFLLLAAVALVASACGDDSGSSSPETTAAESSSDGDVAIPDLDDLDLPGVSDQCVEVAQAAAEAAGAAGAVFTPGGDLSETGAFFDGAIDAAPDEIKDDFEVLAEAFGEYAQAIADAGADLSDPNSFTDPAVLAALEDGVQAFSTDAYQEAADNISAWGEANCSGEG
jgi:hypothetical protein